MSGVILVAAQCYLLGSIPFGYLLVRIFRGEDVRLSGSGNIGATNVSRKSPVLGLLTLILDALKGTAAVKLTLFLSSPARDGGAPYAALSMAALFAVVGHLFPVWLKFRGGKGVATALGSFSLIAPKAVVVAAVIFVLMVIGFRFVSLGSIIAVACFPLAVYVLGEYGGSSLALVFMSATSLLIIARHHTNIRRLLAGTENRVGEKRA
jgi:acyl phosphate:glycerol-3-phosphate acyltransferase